MSTLGSFTDLTSSIANHFLAGFPLKCNEMKLVTYSKKPVKFTTRMSIAVPLTRHAHKHSTFSPMLSPTTASTHFDSLPTPLSLSPASSNHNAPSYRPSYTDLGTPTPTPKGGAPV